MFFFVYSIHNVPHCIHGMNCITCVITWVQCKVVVGSNTYGVQVEWLNNLASPFVSTRPMLATLHDWEIFPSWKTKLIHH